MNTVTIRLDAFDESVKVRISRHGRTGKEG
jgi:hypothetical protein